MGSPPHGKESLFQRVWLSAMHEHFGKAERKASVHVFGFENHVLDL